VSYLVLSMHYSGCLLGSVGTQPQAIAATTPGLNIPLFVRLSLRMKSLFVYVFIIQHSIHSMTTDPLELLE
jgi:hypothetical protein